MPAKAHKTGLLTAFLLLAGITSTFSQKLNFDITLFGDKIGAMQVEQKDSAGFKLYDVQSKFEAKVLFSKKSSASVMHVVFNSNGNLICSYYKNIKTDGVITTTANLQNGKLHVEHNGQKSDLDTPFNASSVVLYFAEPQKLQKIFSERAGKFFDMVKQDNGTYLANLDDGSAKFTYSGNKLAQIEVSKGMLGTIVIKAVP